MSPRAWIRAALTIACPSGLFACFDGQFAQGLACQQDADCGPSLACIDGWCGGLGEPGICGNGLLERGEDCDDGNLDEFDDCSPDCRLPICGDRYVGPGEACDDGNAVDDDDCSNACSRCGDGVVGPGEACDDGNRVDGDTCTSGCRLPSCGNAIVEPGEACDDGNVLDTDACLSSCVPASCGDGFVGPGEACDDGDLDHLDGCTGQCTVSSCDDQIQSGDETDVDCGGSCSGCEIGQGCVDADDCAHQRCRVGVCVEFAQQVVAGDEHTCALLNTGVRCWGRGLGGRLGYGNVGSIGGNIEPASAGLVELGGRAVQLAAGDYHTCARLDDGAVRCWGLNFTGQLGYGHTEPVGDNEVPADLDPVNVGAQVVQLAAGSYHTCARLDGGGVRCWGGGDVGQLGYGNTEAIGDDEDPASQGLVDVGGLVVDLAAGGYSTCAVLQGGAIHCWGQSGALGYPNAGNIGDDEFPASVGPVQIGDAAIEVVVGRYHTCALLQGGAVRCWGSNYHGALGYPGLDTLGIDEHPDTVGPVEVGGPVTKLSAGYQHTCALLDGALRCWGYALYGRLGYGHLDFGDELHVGDDETPASVGDVPLGGIAIDVATGEAHTCALLDGGAVRCWGEGRYGRLGYATLDDIGDDETPSSVGDVPCLLP